ncbi:twin-arginine translocase TatA/TatE family subunit [uncultured Alistipes sp.]|jgi:sec-independent protein translocase protein TatA|uniref:twin-arginine translocase TatA/TatE family subunit n=1 Tax=uncultured Alistipes sp. TaxID=538949 RepID=UPI00272BE66F|nr:twin-arginine translocase TatA/TatE family subunit [uncultured Alistipes sp.]
MMYPCVIGTGQLVIIVLVVLLLFGGKRIPELMRGMGRGVKEFKDAMNTDGKEQDKKDDKDAE